jgi:glycine dehydrogenase
MSSNIAFLLSPNPGALTVAFPEVYGLMIEPTETYSKVELDKFVEVVKSIHTIINEHPEVLKSAPHFTPVKKVDEVFANKELRFMDNLVNKADIFENKIDPIKLSKMSTNDVYKEILKAHQAL